MDFTSLWQWLADVVMACVTFLGGWSTVVSVAALIVSLWTAWWSVAARPVVQADVARDYLGLNEKTTVIDGDQINLVNLGRAPAVVSDVRAITADGRRLKSAVMPRGLESTPTPFPELPARLDTNDVLRVWFSARLAGDDAGHEHGYEVTLLQRSLKGRSVRSKKFVIKTPRPSEDPTRPTPNPSR